MTSNLSKHLIKKLFVLSIAVIINSCTDFILETDDGSQRFDSYPGPTPQIISTFPYDKSEDVNIDTEVYINFDVDMDPSTINFTFINLCVNNAESCSLPPVSYNTNLKRAIINTPQLLPDTEYKVTIYSDIKSLEGAYLGYDYFYIFTTGN